jgi:STE24 endopeptidase
MEETSTKAKQYSKIETRLTIIQLLLTALFLVVVLFSGASSYLKELVTGGIDNFYLQVGLYLLFFWGIYYLVFLGLDFYAGFLLEHKFELSNQTVLGWLRRSVKKTLLSLLIFLPAAEVLYFFLRHFPNTWWLPTTAAWFLLTIVLGRITPALIIPLFYRCRPLADGKLKETLLSLGKNCGVVIKKVFEIRLSKETKKANAAVAGIGKSRRILLGDTLLNSFSDEEIEAVFAHDWGTFVYFIAGKFLGSEQLPRWRVSI